MTAQGSPVAVIVDVYTCSEPLLQGFLKAGAEVVQVRPRPEVAPAIPGMAYLASVEGADVGDLAARLAGYSPVAVVAGQEPDVPLADALAAKLGLAGNDPARSLVRRDKFAMIEALREAGLHCADQFKSGDVDEVVGWALRLGRFPVVVKPLTSAGTDKVTVCRTAGEVRQAASAIIGTATIFDDPNDEVLVQSYLEGTEYVVDMVSVGGRRYTCGVWEYRKKLLHGKYNIYDTETILPHDEHPVPELIAYVDKALAALGIEHGSSHAEVILTPDGPALVEVGARTGGNMQPDFHDRCLGANQADVAALSYVDPERFLAEYADRTYRKLKEAWVYSTPTDLDGVVDHWDEAVLADIDALPSVFWKLIKAQPGGTITPTISLKTSTMKICLLADDETQLLEDYQRIQELKDKVFHLR
ncbi:ATP-grasp domain-containing protein [Lentzea sp. NPDC003310]|uniref:ATP-grasp domain-containing protein n=1 Tax=Lentzea sp. NPDC003310 TaxID=3154447 RepID=UPI0033A9B465